MKKTVHEISVAVTLLLLLGAMAIWTPSFYDPQPLLSRTTSAVPKMMIAVGVSLALVTRHIDISTGSMLAICCSVMGMISQTGHGWTLTWAAGIGVGMALGAVNGALIAGLGLPSIIVTLAMMFALREGVRLWTQGVFINLKPNAQWFGLEMVSAQWAIVVAGLSLTLAVVWSSRFLTVGRYFYLIGSDPESAFEAGLPVRRITFMSFVLNGTLVGLAAGLTVAQAPQVDPGIGQGLELEMIAAAVVGGIAVNGGRGRLWGVMVGMALLVCIAPALTYMGVAAYWEKAIQGVIILAAVSAEGIRKSGTQISIGNLD